MSQSIARERCFARVRADLLHEEEFPPTSLDVDLTPNEWEMLKFPCWPIQGYDDNLEPDFNLLLQHPINGMLFWAYSIDFDFEARGE